MKVGRVLTLAAVCVAASGCFHQVVQTGRPPGPTAIDKPWTNFFLWGLVPPPPMDVTAECKSGIATVVTEMSFVNGLANLVTLGIYSPRHVTITCASGAAIKPGSLDIYVEKGASRDEMDRAVARAVEESARLEQPVVIHF